MLLHIMFSIFCTKACLNRFCPPLFNVFSQAAVEHVLPWHGESFAAQGAAVERLELGFPTSGCFVWHRCSLRSFLLSQSALYHLLICPHLSLLGCSSLHGWGKTRRTQWKSPKMEMKNLSDIWSETVLDFSWKKRGFLVVFYFWEHGFPPLWDAFCVSCFYIKKISPEITALGLSASGSPLLLKQHQGHAKDLTPSCPCGGGGARPGGVIGGAAQMDCAAVASDVPGPCMHTPIRFLFLSVH